MLELKNVSKKYFGKGDEYALLDVSLSIPQGEIIGLFGENGAGKTTMMKSILGFHSFEGKITLDGEPVTHKNIAKIYAKGVRDFAMVLSENFSVLSELVNDVNINYFYVKDKNSQESLDVAKQALLFFEQKIVSRNAQMLHFCKLGDL